MGMHLQDAGGQVGEADKKQGGHHYPGQGYGQAISVRPQIMGDQPAYERGAYDAQERNNPGEKADLDHKVGQVLIAFFPAALLGEIGQIGNID